MRALTVTLVACIVAAPLALQPAAAVDESWREKVSASLRAALAGDAPPGAVDTDGRLRLLVTGEPLPTPAAGLATRAQWTAYWSAASEPWLASLRTIARENGMDILGEWPAAPSIELLGLPEHVETLASLDSVVAVGLDHDAAVTAQALEGVSPAAGESIGQTGAPTFWNAGFRGEGVLLAIIDTGIAASHPMLLDATNGCATRTVKWRDFVANRAGAYDDHGHGTHVAGTAAGTTGCAGQLDGVAPNARLMGVKILSSSGTGSWANAQNGLQWAFDNGADITSNSWGGGDSADSRAVAQLVDNLARGGMESAFATSNGGSSPGSIGWPGQADLAITVGAVDLSKNIASFSGRGPCSDGRTCPDVVAVGVNVVSSWPNGGTATLSGTSMATPHVGGAGALIIQATRELVGRELLRPGEVGVVKSELEDLLVRTAEDLGAAGPDNTFGWGYIRLAPIYDDILSRARAQVLMTSALDDPLLRRGESAVASFELRNVGGKPGTGELVATLHSPGGPTELARESVVVGAGARVARTFTLSGDALAPGDHRVRATYAYQWTDPVTGETVAETLVAEQALRVERAELDLAKAMPAQTGVGHAFEVALTLTNVGNLPATAVALAEEIPGAYVVAPRGFGGTLSSLWSDPAPATKLVRIDLSTRMTYAVGDLDPGASWTVRYQLLAARDGTHPHASHATFGDDGVGRLDADLTTMQSVSMLPPS